MFNLCIFSGIGCLSPFFTSHMRHLGFTLSEISFINAVSAFFSIIGPLLGGTFAERRDRYKSTTVFFMLVGALSFIALSFVPRYDKLNYKPLVDFDCDAGLRVERCVNWVTCGEALDTSENFTKVKLTNCHYQCPNKGHFVSTYPLHMCFHGHDGNICVVFDDSGKNNSITEFESQLQTWPYVEVPAQDNATSVGGSHEEEVPRAHVAMCNYLPLAPVSFNKKQYQGISCRPDRDDCSIHCKVEFFANGLTVFPRPCEEAFGNPTTTFWSYLILRSIGDLCLLTSICLLDAVTIWSTVDYEGSYGRIHVWAALGIAALAPFSGALIDYKSGTEGRIDISPSSFISAGFALVSCVFIIFFPIHKLQSTQIQQTFISTKDGKSKFFSGEMIVFLIIVLVLGMQWSILFTFLPWLTMDIGCSATQMGIASTLMFGFSIPFLLISKNMVRNIGKANLLVFSFLFYFTRYAGITFVSSPWWTLPFSLMGSFTLCVMWIATVAYGQKLTPPGHSLIMQYLLNVLHFGVGKLRDALKNFLLKLIGYKLHIE